MSGLESGTLKTRARYKCLHHELPETPKIHNAFSSILLDVDLFMDNLASELSRRGFRVHLDVMSTVTTLTVQVGSSVTRWDTFFRAWDKVTNIMAKRWSRLVRDAKSVLSNAFPDRARVEDTTYIDWGLLATITFPRAGALELYALDVRIKWDEVDAVFLCEAPYWVHIVTVESAPGLTEDDLERAALVFTGYYNREEEVEEVVFTSDGKPIPLSELRKR